jgi:ribonuclease HII
VELARYPNAAGTDEAGRGPLAGPVVAAAVVLPDSFDLQGIQDSKILKEKDRHELEIRIKADCDWTVEIAWTDEVDRINILRASLAAMSRAISRLKSNPCVILVDGHMLPPDLPCEGKAVVKGDSTYACIAAASILAKNERDRIMRNYAVEYPGYGFEKHFGYATPQHRNALAKLGPCPIHRRSFAPVNELLQPTLMSVDE